MSTPGQFTLNPVHGATEKYIELPEDKQKICWGTIVVLTALLILSYLDSFERISYSWSTPQYSHGYLIPLFAIALLAMRRKLFVQVPTWHRWVGCAIVAAGIAMRLVGGVTVTFSLDNMSFIPCVLGIFVMVGGLPSFKWAGPAVAFLFFMYPFPRAVEDMVMRPMQKLATMASNYVLITLGVDCYREGNVINLVSRDMPLNVAEQCSGLRMLTIFTALAVAMALIFTDRTWWERALIVISAIPIAIGVNVFRITLTGVLYNLNVNTDLADKVFHDLAGWIMMPLALGLLYLEIHILGRLFVDTPQEAAPVRVA